jgi:hypothetical protein
VIREKTKSKWASDSSENEDEPKPVLPAAVTSLQQEISARSLSLSQHSSPAHMATPPPPAQEDVLGGLYDENGEALENEMESETGGLGFKVYFFYFTYCNLIKIFITRQYRDAGKSTTVINS